MEAGLVLEKDARQKLKVKHEASAAVFQCSLACLRTIKLLNAPVSLCHQHIMSRLIVVVFVCDELDVSILLDSPLIVYRILVLELKIQCFHN